MHFMFKYFTQDKSSWCITSSLKEKTEKTRALKTAGKWFRISAFFLNFILRRGWWIVLSSRLGQAVPGLSLHNIRILEFLNSDINLEFSSSPGWKHILFTFVGTFDQSQFQVCLANIIKTTIIGACPVGSNKYLVWEQVLGLQVLKDTKHLSVPTRGGGATRLHSCYRTTALLSNSIISISNLIWVNK